MLRQPEDPEDGADMFLRRRLKLNWLHGVMSQKMILFITTAVKTSKSTSCLESQVYTLLGISTPTFPRNSTCIFQNTNMTAEAASTGDFMCSTSSVSGTHISQEPNLNKIPCAIDVCSWPLSFPWSVILVRSPYVLRASFWELVFPIRLLWCREDWCSGNALALYSWDARFESYPGHWLLWLRFLVGFLSPIGKCRDNTSRLGHVSFCPNPFRFVTYQSFYQWTLYSERYWQNLKINQNHNRDYCGLLLWISHISRDFNIDT
jgi:hypothetical protein